MRLYMKNLSNISLQGNAIIILLYPLSEVPGKLEFLSNNISSSHILLLLYGVIYWFHKQLLMFYIRCV